MFEWTLLPLITLAFLELVTDLVTFPPFLRSTTTRRTLSVGIATTIAFGGCSFCVLRTTGLVLLCNAVMVLSQPFSVDQILHGLMEETVRLLMGLFGCTIKNLNAVFQQLTGTDLPKKDNYPLARHLQEL